MLGNNRKSTVNRREDILKTLSEKGKVFVQELSEKYQVSEVTIRNDLDKLEKKDLLIKARGGAIKVDFHVRSDQRISEKYQINIKEKARIGKLASQQIENYDTIIIDSGSTTAELAKNLNRFEDLTVITNAVNIINILLNIPGINIIVPGGYLRKNSNSLIGPPAEENLRKFHVDKLFLGVDGFDSSVGLYTPNIEEAHLNQLMIDNSNEIIVLSDSSKFKRKSLAFICGVKKINKLITDDGIDPKDMKQLQDAGIEVLIA
ncbi:MAG: DeoR family transcriptional regulator [Cyclobacteriaceae bacterium]|nr:MAG: DeoR family transcriptional regulator [Cyclobacteriaceae bacterium]